MPSKGKQISIDSHLWRSLGDVGQELKYDKADKRGAHSKLIREMVTAAIMKWHESPYICLSASHLVLVTGEGHVFYRQVQVLKLNSKRERLPCIMEMKPEKRRDFRKRCPGGKDESQWFRSQWLINYFAAWHGKSADGPPLSSWMDTEGTDSKIADLLVEQGKGRFLVREVIVGVRDYVQWQDDTPGYDRIDLPIDIPTRDLEFTVVVDLDLYRRGPSEEEVADLEVEFRNREGAKFAERRVAADGANNLAEIVPPGRRTREFETPGARAVLDQVQELTERIKFVAHTEGDPHPVMTAKELSELDSLLQTPERFLFLKVKWPSAYWGIELCIRWEKPIKDA